MLLQIVCVHDRAADAFGQPSFVVSIGGAIRGFTDEINRPDEKNMLYKHCDDFDLFHLGTYDDHSATFEFVAGGRRLLCRGGDVKRST